MSRFATSANLCHLARYLRTYPSGIVQSTDGENIMTPELSVADVILQMLDEDAAIDGAVRDGVLDALAEVGDGNDSASGHAASTF